MVHVHTLIVELEERLPSGTARLGTADLTLAATAAIRRGEEWKDDRVPATPEVSAALGHRGRVAAWRGDLYSKGLNAAFSAFASSMTADGLDRLEFHISILQAARRVAAHAEWLAAAVAKAKPLEWPSEGRICCPLTGEIMPCHAVSDLDSPFAFGVVEGVFAGVDAGSFADFLRDCDGTMNAAEYLSHSMSFPELWFTEPGFLDEAGVEWLATGDFGALAAAVGRWNDMQRGGVPFCDVTKIHLLRGETRKGVLAWCRDHILRSRGLVDGVGEQSFSTSR